MPFAQVKLNQDFDIFTNGICDFIFNGSWIILGTLLYWINAETPNFRGTPVHFPATAAAPTRNFSANKAVMHSKLLPVINHEPELDQPTHPPTHQPTN